MKRAADYFARRHDESLFERREREVWLDEDVRHECAYAEMQRLWDRAGEFRADPAWQTLKNADLAALRASRRPGRSAWIALAALLLLLLGGAWWYAPFLAPPSPLTLATHIGERRTEALADGTRVVLNTDSMLQTRYTRGRRDVDLQQGEAQFDVTHDAARPFVVNIGSSSVTALGTRFQVRRDADAVVVTLLQGSVQVAQGQVRRVLSPNEQARLSASGIRVETIDPVQVDGWLDGWLRFHNASLRDVLADANRYSSRKLTLGDPRLASLVFSGNYRSGDNASIAAAAEQLLPVHVEDRGNELVLLPK